MVKFTDSKLPKIPFTLFWLLAIYHALYLVGIVRLGTMQSLEAIFNADMLFLQDFAQDVMSGWNFRDWKFPVAPFIFPDAILSFPAALLGWNNPPVYLAIYGYLQTALGLFGLGLIAGSLPPLTLQPKSVRSFSAPTVAIVFGILYWMLIVFLSATAWPLEHMHLVPLQPILPQMHGGTYAWTLVCYGLFLNWQRRPSRFLGCVLVVSLVLGCAGNALFLATTLFPIGCCLTTLQLLKMRPFACSGIAIKFWPLALALVYFAGRIGSKLIPHERLAAQSEISIEAITTSLRVFAAGFVDDLVHLDPASCLDVLAAVGFLAWLVTVPKRIKSSKLPANLTFIVLFASAATLTPAILIAGGSNGLAVIQSYGWSTKYLTPMIIGPVIALYLLLTTWAYSARHIFASKVLSDKGMSVSGLIVMSVAFLVAFTMLVRSHSGVFSYEPAIINNLANCEELKDVRRLYCDFWQTRLVNLFSDGRFRAQPLDNELKPYHWLCSRGRIDQPGSVEGPFAILVPEPAAGTANVLQALCIDKLGAPHTCVRVNKDWLALVYASRESNSDEVRISRK